MFSNGASVGCNTVVISSTSLTAQSCGKFLCCPLMMRYQLEVSHKFKAESPIMLLPNDGHLIYVGTAHDHPT